MRSATLAAGSSSLSVSTRPATAAGDAVSSPGWRLIWFITVMRVGRHYPQQTHSLLQTRQLLPLGHCPRSPHAEQPSCTAPSRPRTICSVRNGDPAANTLVSSSARAASAGPQHSGRAAAPRLLARKRPVTSSSFNMMSSSAGKMAAPVAAAWARRRARTAAASSSEEAGLVVALVVVVLLLRGLLTLRLLPPAPIAPVVDGVMFGECCGWNLSSNAAACCGGRAATAPAAAGSAGGR
jgi:hypothetical protein